jgi:hypothetical protein
MSSRHSCLGADGGSRPASSTALVYRSSVRKHTFGGGGRRLGGVREGAGHDSGG